MNWKSLKSKKKIGFAVLMIIALFIIVFTAVKLQIDAQAEDNVNSEQVLSFSASPQPAAASPASSAAATTAPTPSPTPSHAPKITLENYYIDYKQMNDPLLLLVGPKVKIPDDFSFGEVDYDGVPVNGIMYADLDRLLKDGRAEGADLWLASGFRPQDEQERLLEEGIQNRMDDYGMSYEEAEADALQSFTVPGYSEHHTGLSVDFNDVSRDFADSFEGRWLIENSWQYGFVQRYPPQKQEITGIMHEPWHYRYVGLDHAEKMKELGYCLEEYIVYLKNQGET